MTASILLRLAAVGGAGLMLSGCLAVAATKTAVGVTGAVVGTGVKATGAVVGAVIPGGGDKDEDEN
ncbi:NF038104 family lipoprotein [Phenylobacterium sp. VNQ135]|uniref:NF038104 family lipoprotein n=1 Tax=Phenylobacterium sp. VNQ135 TaxID=3400922 RepID=UPI003BFCF86C